MPDPLSFTREYSLRFPAPDVARGFMLLLIALANVRYWADAVGPRFFDARVDAVLTLLRVGFVDHRAYPLFAMLFGFGLMTMVKRRRRAYVDRAVHALATQGYVAHDPVGEASIGELFDRDATRSARRLLRNRGWWMLLIGALHGLLFPGDVIGTYALVCLVFASTIARERYLAPVIVGGIIAAVMLPAALMMSIFDPGDVSAGAFNLVTFDYSAWGLLTNAGMWLGVTIGGALTSLVILSMGVGAYLATTDIVKRPDQHRRLLQGAAVAGLLIGFLGGLPAGLHVSELMNVELQWWMEPLNHLAGFFGALGWLALLVAFAGPTPMSGELRGVRWVLSAVGRRSMTCYLLQSVFFLLIFVQLSWYGARVSELAGVLISVGVWVVTVGFAVVLEYAGWQGPFERLLRFLVAKTSRPVVSSVFSQVPSAPVMSEAAAAHFAPAPAVGASQVREDGPVGGTVSGSTGRPVGGPLWPQGGVQGEPRGWSQDGSQGRSQDRGEDGSAASPNTEGRPFSMTD